MYMYQGLGQMLTKRLRHHQGCSETPKCAYVIYGQSLIRDYEPSDGPSFEALDYSSKMWSECQLLRPIRPRL